MKLNVFKTIIAIAISALLAYTFSIYNNSVNDWVLPVCVGTVGCIMLVCALALDISYLRSMLNIKILSGIFFLVCIITNALYAFVGVSTPKVIITNGFFVLIHILLVYGLAKANKD
jgi:hypothetical protein